MKSMKLGSTAGRSKPTTPLSTPDHTHPDSLAPDSERPQQGTTKSAASAQKSVIPRTRDDSSDEEDRPLTSQTGPLKDGAQSLMGHAPILPHPSFPGSYPPMPHPHMMPPPPRGLPEHYYPPHHPGRGLVGPAPLPPRSSGGGILSQPPPPMVRSDALDHVNFRLITLCSLCPQNRENILTLRSPCYDAQLLEAIKNVTV